MKRWMLGGAISIFLLSGCGDDAVDGVELLWDPSAGQLTCFPDDAFTRDDATSRTGIRPDLTPEKIPMLADVPEQFQDMFADLGRLDGFGLGAGVYVQFEEAIDPATLDGGVFLMADVGGTPTPWPFEHELVDEGFDRPGQTLVLVPLRPLPPATRAFVAVTDHVRAADGRPIVPSAAMKAALARHPEGAAATRVAERMADAAASLDTDDRVVGVVTFTTQSAWEEASAIAADVAARDVRPAEGTTCTPEKLWIRCEGTFTAVDYRGADEVIGETIPPSPATYVVPFTAWLPLERPGPYGGTAFPTVLFGHGLGGERQQAERLAQAAAPIGIATIAIDALSHGGHPTATSTETLFRVLSFFGISTEDNTFRPLVMRDHFRQSTYDKLQLVRMLMLGVDLDGDATVDLDPQRLMYLGVSLGGIMGPELLQLAPEIGAGLLIVPGGRVSSIVSDGAMFQILVELLKPPGTTDGEVARFWPVLQTLLDRGDAATWGVHLLHPSTRPAVLPPAEPHVLVGMVIDDDTVPNVSTRALARAMDVPLVPPVLQPIDLLATTSQAPVSANGEDGRTVGLLQFDHVVDEAGTTEPATHSNIGDSSVGIEAWMRFMDGYLQNGTPVIVDPYAELGL